MLSNKEIGDRIYQARHDLDLTLDDIASRIGVTKSTVQRYEKGNIEKIKLPVITAIANVLQVNSDWLLGNNDDPVPASSPLLHSSPVPRPIDPMYDSLNPTGQGELCRYGRYLSSMEEYRADDSEPPIIYIKHYLVPSAAGYASPIEGEDYENIPLPAGAPSEADFCLNIQGDSMEPYIHDGELVYVKRDAPLSEFEPGIFFVDGDVLCKQWCKDYTGALYLLSANPARQDANRVFARDSGQSVVCYGKVLLNKKLPRPAYY